MSTAIRILNIIADADRPLALGEIAQRADIGPSTAHRYIQSLVEEGLTVQDGPNMPYDLGPTALRLGIAALRRIDQVEAAAREMKILCADLAISGGVAVWTRYGPTLVRWYRNEVFSVASVKLGDVLPLDNTACGYTYQAYLPEQEVAVVRDQQPASFRGSPPCPQVLQDIRKAQGYSMIGRLQAGVTGQAAAVFDAQGEVCCCMTIVAGLGFDETPSNLEALFEAANRVNGIQTSSNS